MSKKRAAESQLVKGEEPDDVADDGRGAPHEGPMPTASPDQMAQRKVVKVKRAQPQTGTGGLFGSIDVGGAPKAPASGSGGFASLFASVGKPEGDKQDAGKSDASATTPPKTSGFDFTAPPASGTTFGAPKFPPLGPESTYESLVVPPAKKEKTEEKVEKPFFTNFSGTPNKMAELAEKTDKDGDKGRAKEAEAASGEEKGEPKEADAAPKHFAPSAQAFKQPEASLFPPAKTDSSDASTTSSSDAVVYEAADMTLLEANEEKAWVEKGDGIVKVTKPKDGGQWTLAMWRHGTLRIALSIPLVHPVFMLPSTSPSEKAVMFVAYTDGKSRTYCLRVKKGGTSSAKDLHAHFLEGLKVKAQKEEIQKEA